MEPQAALMRERMTWRKWLVRSLVFSVLGLVVLVALLYEAWTNPTAVRQLVHDKLCKLFVNATVNLDSARLRLLGGIGIRDLRMGRRDELDRGDWLYVPSAIIYHDKEHLLTGELGVRKIEMDRPRIRIVRDRDGRINVAGLLAPPDLKEHVPTLIIRRGILQIEDRCADGSSLVLEIKDVNLSIVNDPLSTLVLEGDGQTDALGPVRLRGRVQRATGATSALVELPSVPVGPTMVGRLAGYCPEVKRYINDLNGKAAIETMIAYRPEAAEPWSYDVHGELNDGYWSADYLPSPLYQMHAELRCVNGRIPHAMLRARCDGAEVGVDLWNLVWNGKRPKNLEDLVAKLEVKVDGLALRPEHFKHLPPLGAKIQRIYNPAGPVSLSYIFQRYDAERWEKHCEIRPQGMTAEFEHFRYLIKDITGSIVVDLASDRDDYIRIDLAGRGGERPVTVRGFIRGDENSEVDIVVAADDVSIDHRLISALPAGSQDVARTFLPTHSRELGLSKQPLGLVRPAGLANVKVFVRRARGQEQFANRYLIYLHNAAVKYDVFPITWEKVSGVLDIYPDHWECRDFHGSRKGGEITVQACSYREDVAEVRASVRSGRRGNATRGTASVVRYTTPEPSEKRPQRECVQVSIRGKDIPLDSEFEQALSPPEMPGRAALRNAWSMLALRGKLSFESFVVDRPDQPQDIDVTVDVQGCSMQPDFFRYAMTDVSAGVRYTQGRVFIKDMSAKHQGVRLGLKHAIVDLKPTGGFTAWFTDIHGDELLIDEDFLRALHPTLRHGLECLQIRKPLRAVARQLTVDAPGVPGEPMKIWWEGGASLRQQQFQAGVDIDDVDGEIWCNGYYNGRQLEGVSGRAVLERARILGQPFTKLQGRIVVAPETPEVLSLYDLKADLFGGVILGEARFTFRSPMRYEVKLDALHVQLEQFGKHNQLGPDAQLEGPARAALYLSGEGTDLSGLRGNGQVEVARGKMYRLPLLLDLLKAFGLRLPDRTAFEQARMIFGIEGPQMRIRSLDLYGNAISLRGLGTLNLDGSNLNLDFSADWGRMPQLLPQPMSNLSQAVSDQLFKIKLRGKISSPRFEKEILPPVVEPIKKVFGGS
jgi:hypothetical protein